MEKKIKTALQSNEKHWVGDGFHVFGLLRPTEQLNPFISPFILMDYAPPKEFPKTQQRLGVGEHPHRGFETVTIAYQGEIEHRDSSGAGGIIKSGDVQWMTAGKGIIHDEFHSKNFAGNGGIFEMVQLWVNLPAKNKMTSPKYQEIKSESIPNIPIGNNGSILKIIAGDYQQTRGPASTFTPIQIYDLESKIHDELIIRLKENTNTLLLILSGKIICQKQTFDKNSLLIFEQSGTFLNLQTSNDFKGLLLNGEPIPEPVVAYGPFVMNTPEEISQAFSDFRNGHFV